MASNLYKRKTIQKRIFYVNFFTLLYVKKGKLVSTMFLLAAKNAKEKKALAKNVHEKLLFLKKKTRTSTPGELGQAHITQKNPSLSTGICASGWACTVGVEIVGNL
ncbi:MAG: hypothetical protein E7107_10635 [Prevotella sp.]|nr:hypothetical protein [Prevotella sp.]